jgi:cation diffusion facilitator CzcD-associated flavoprotein CzcO
MVHKYFQDYATHFGLWPYIRFNTRVERLYQDPQTTEWTIEHKDIKSGAIEKEEFDCICVANGHYEDGWTPDIPGLSHVPFLTLDSVIQTRC